MTYATAPSMSLPEGVAPEWLHLLPAGPIQTQDGRGPYRIVDPQAVITTSMMREKLTVDVNHATDLAAPHGRAAPARGWITELQARPTGIWGRVEWTGTGRQMVVDREYRGVSPVIAHNRSGEITAILRASLTNTPNITGLTTLHSAMSPPLGALAPAVIMQKARELQATFSRAGLPIDLPNAIASIMEEEVENRPMAMKPAEIELHAQQLQATFNKLGMKIDFVGAVRSVMERR